MARRTLSEKQYSDLKAVYAVQKNEPSTETDPYMRGFFNGMELMMAIVEKRAPVYRESKTASQLDAWGRKNL